MFLPDDADSRLLLITSIMGEEIFGNWPQITCRIQ